MRTLLRNVFMRLSLVILLSLYLCTFASGQTDIPSPRRGKQAQQHSATIARKAPATVSSGNWSQLAKFAESKSFIPCCSDFGAAVAISGDTIVVADSNPNPQRTVAYVFVKPADGWKNATPVAALSIPGTGSAPSENSAAIAGDTIVLGGGYVYVKPSSGWTDMGPTATLTASDATALGGVAISGNTVVATNPFANNYEGTAYVFVKPAGGWKNMTQTAQLSASDGQANDELGWSASISGGTIVLGTIAAKPSGKAYVFVEPAGGWSNETQMAELTASVSMAGFGYSVATDGDEVLVGAFDFYTVGAAYMFVKPATGWANATENARLSPIDGAQYDQFGYSVAVRGKSAAIGAPARTSGIFYAEGGAYIFTEPAGGWHSVSSSTVVTGSDGRQRTSFGSSVALVDNLLVVGAPELLFHSAYLFGLP